MSYVADIVVSRSVSAHGQLYGKVYASGKVKVWLRRYSGGFTYIGAKGEAIKTPMCVTVKATLERQYAPTLGLHPGSLGI